jgi:hypothetical protein
MNIQPVGSTVLLAGGVVLVIAGLASALGYSTGGMVATFAAISALLYAGGVWFGGAPNTDVSVVLFTPALTIASGPLAGHAVTDLFPDHMRGEIDTQCRVALTGHTARFGCGKDGGEKTFEASPVRTADGLVIYGLLLSGALVADARFSSAGLATFQ